MNTEGLPTVAQVIGRNAQRIRGDQKIEKVAMSARGAGLKWNSGRVYEMENGRVSPTIPTLLALCMALSDATQQPVAVADLLDHDGPVRLNDQLTLDGAEITAALQGEPADLRRTESERFDQALYAIAVRQAGGETEQRAAQSLGISGGEFVKLAQTLWGRSFADERDHRAGGGANAQKRGQVARRLKAEMKTALGRDRRGDD